jgi:hypothetical protein
MANVRFQRRKRIGGIDFNGGKRGISMTKAGKHGSIGVRRRGPRLSVRIISGLGAMFGKR